MARKPDISLTDALNPSSNQNRSSTVYQTPQGSFQTDIEHVSPYEKNPRLAQGEEYDSTYQSIKSKGLEGVLIVTQRPDNTDPNQYILLRGGNTRLDILNQLYQETKDKKYYTFQAVYQPWVSESDAIIGHLSENDSRSRLQFMERALGIRKARIELQAELNTQLSDKPLIRELAKQGYKLSRADLIRMNFAVDHLYPHCPALLQSVGPKQIDAIQVLQSKAAELFQEIHPDKKPAFFKQQFGEILTALEQSQKSYSYEILYNDVLAVLANEEHVTANRLDYLLDSRINGIVEEPYTAELIQPNQPPSQPAPVDPDSSPSASASTDNSAANTEDFAADEPSLDNLLSPTTEHDDTQDTTVATEGNNQESTSPITPPSANTTQHHPVTLDYAVLSNPNQHLLLPEWEISLHNDVEFGYFDNLSISCGDRREVAPLPDDADALRKIMHYKAVCFSHYMGVPGQRIEKLNTGMGYTLNFIPPASSMEAISQAEKYAIHQDPLLNRNVKHYIGWWLLFGLSDLIGLFLQHADLIPAVLPDGNLKQFMLNPKYEDQTNWLTLAFEQGIDMVTITDPFQHFISYAKPKEFQLFLELQILNRHLKQACEGDVWVDGGAS